MLQIILLSVCQYQAALKPLKTIGLGLMGKKMTKSGEVVDKRKITALDCTTLRWESS